MRPLVSLLLGMLLVVAAHGQATRSQVRFWTDSTGKFKTRAEFVSLVDGNVTLRRPGTDKTVTLPLARLSDKDQAYIQRLLAKDDPPSNDDEPAAEDEGTEQDLDTGADADPDAGGDAASIAEPPPAPATQPAVRQPIAPARRPANNNVINSVRGAVYRTETMNNMKQIALAMHNYEAQFGRFPAAALNTADGKPGLSWRVAILPMLEENSLYQQFRRDEPWDSPHNQALIRRMPAIFGSPGAELDPGHTNYLAIRDEAAVISSGTRKVTMAQIPDGTSLTIMLVEADDTYAVPWTKPDDYDWDQQQPAYGLGGIWGGTFFAAFADGSVRRIPATISSAQLNGLFTRNGGEAVQIPD